MALPGTIGRYEITRLVGQGGMGRVLAATDSVLGRTVAVKILRDDIGLAPETRAKLFARMKIEARAAAAVSHPNLVTLHDMGEDDTVGLYLVFELVQGKSLREKLADGPLDLGDVAHFAREIGSALTAAHEAGVVHRDVKPENVLFATTGTKVTDFGIARIPDATPTTASTVLGATAYSAPEALAAGTFDAKSDQFSFAALLYEAICGVRAFKGDDAAIVAKKIASDDPRPLEAVLADPRVVSRINAVLRRGLAKDPAARFISCDALGEALASAIDARDLTDGPPVSTRVAIDPTLRPSVILRKQTHRLQNIFAAAGLLVIVGLILFGKHPATDSDKNDAALSDSARLPPSGTLSSAPPRVPRHPRHTHDDDKVGDAGGDSPAAMDAGE